MRRNFSEARARRAVEFIQKLKHTKGEYAGHNFILQDWQRDKIIRPLFGTVNPDGTRQYRTCYVELPRKNGKTTIASAIALYLLYADSEAGCEIYSAANDRQQAALVFNEAAAMVRQEPNLFNISKIIDSQKRIVYHRFNSFYCAISAEAYTKWGINAHGIIYDELHAAPDRDLWDTLTTSTGSRRQPLTLVITTAGFDRNSICWEQHNYALKVQNGIIQDSTFLPVIFSAPEDADWKDEKVWKSSNPALGTFRNIDEMRTLCKKAQETAALEMTFRRLYLNQWVNSVESWLPMDAWDTCNSKVNVEKLQGRTCYAGLDLASTTDLTALALVFIDNDGTLDVLVHFWIPGDTAVEREKRDRVPYRAWAKEGLITFTEGNVIDYKYIQHTLEQLREKYDIAEVAFDRWGATKLVQDLTDAGFLMVPFGQGFASMSPPTKELMNLVLSKKIRHGGNPVLRWNCDNLVVRTDPAGNIKPDKEKSTQKIDGMVALIMAIDRASRHSKLVGASIYEDKGMVTL
ncbi:MAG: terminase large subunit [Chloroflexi bacterium]|nr:terminase large subunit [Chloroflexota bacterium]